MRGIYRYLVLVLFLIGMLPTHGNQVAIAAETVTISIDNAVTLRATVADTPASRRQGLSGQTTLAATEAMLFVFDPPTKACLWMKNTTLSLVAAFADGSGKIVKMATMQPQTTDLHCASSVIHYAIEANPQALQGIVRIGSQLRIDELSTVQKSNVMIFSP